jgi:LSD1 subclass zinc finger protein
MTMEELSSDQVTRTGTRFPCKECGALLEYAPGTTELKCPYCGTGNQIATEKTALVEEDFRAELARLQSQAETQEQITLKCQACAAEFEPPPNVTATDCPYCGFHQNITQRTAKLIKPKWLLPFKITREGAQESFFKWLGSLWFAPNKLRRFAEAESKLSGMYMPCWTYDADTVSHYTGQRGDAYYVTVGSGKNRRTERRIRWTSVSGVVRDDFDDVLVLASRSLPEHHADQLEPWDLKNLVPYADEYLSGFRCECYQIDLVHGFDRARQIMDEHIRHTIRDDIGGDEQRITSVNTVYRQITYKHLLLPVWISAYRFGNRVFRFLVNARTGEVQGERPWSWIKITLASLLAAIIIAVIVLIAARQ